MTTSKFLYLSDEPATLRVAMVEFKRPASTTKSPHKRNTSTFKQNAWIFFLLFGSFVAFVPRVQACTQVAGLPVCPLVCRSVSLFMSCCLSSLLCTYLPYRYYRTWYRRTTDGTCRALPPKAGMQRIGYCTYLGPRRCTYVLTRRA
jgi:hypothetical protein